MPLVTNAQTSLRHVVQNQKKEIEDALNLHTFVLLEYAELDFTADNASTTKAVNNNSIDNIFDRTAVIPISNIRFPELWRVGKYDVEAGDTTGELTYIGERSLPVRITASVSIVGVDGNVFVLNIFKDVEGTPTVIEANKGARIINTSGHFNRISVEVNTEIKKNDIITARITSLAGGASSSVPFVNAHISVQPLKLVYPTSFNYIAPPS